MEYFLDKLSHNTFILAVTWVILLDSFLGTLRALKEGHFNSGVGIDGAIRKVAMIGSLCFLTILDIFFRFNLLFMLPQEWRTFLNVENMGLCEFFAILFILFEGTSVLKNMLLCGLPVPKALSNKLEKFLNTMTDELKEG